MVGSAQAHSVSLSKSGELITSILDLELSHDLRVIAGKIEGSFAVLSMYQRCVVSKRAATRSSGRRAVLGRAYVVRGVDVCPRVQQRLRGRRVPSAAGQHKGGPANLPDGAAVRRTRRVSERRRAAAGAERRWGGRTLFLTLRSAPASSSACAIAVCPW